MAYFDDPQKVQDYIKMCEGYDGSALVSILQKHLPLDSTLLELGMGPGNDFDLLTQLYQTTGTDSSQEFVNIVKKKHPGSNILKLDAVTIDIDQTFDGIFTNKVLQHLTKDELQRSFTNQHKRLETNGLAFHTLWCGDTTESFDGLLFNYYTKETILPYFSPYFNLVDFQQYDELEKDDSFYIVLRKK